MKVIFRYAAALFLILNTTACKGPYANARVDDNAYFVLSQSLCDQPEMTSLPVNFEPREWKIVLGDMFLVATFNMKTNSSGTMTVDHRSHPLRRVTRCQTPDGKVFVNFECEIDSGLRSLALAESPDKERTYSLLSLYKSELESAGAPFESFSPSFPDRKFAVINPHNSAGVFILDLIKITFNSDSVKLKK